METCMSSVLTVWCLLKLYLDITLKYEIGEADLPEAILTWPEGLKGRMFSTLLFKVK